MKEMQFFSKLVLLAALLIAVAAIYRPGLAGSFVFDDAPNIVGSTSLAVFDGSLASLVSASTNGVASPLGRPISMASFALNLHYFGQAPYSFKLVNLLIHLANGLLLFIFVQLSWPAFAPRRNAYAPALVVAAIWLLHPINLTPVLFIVQRMTGLAAFFTLMALCLYIAGRRTHGARRFAAIAAALLVCWPLGLLCKENAAVLPLFLLLCEHFILGGTERLSRRAAFIGGGVIGILGIAALSAFWAPLVAGYAFRDFSISERLMTEARVLWLYVLQILVPLPRLFALHHDDLPISRSLIDPVTTLAAITGWIAVAAVAVHWRKRRPLLAFAIGWFLVAHLLESTILPLEIAYEHRNYLASLGILMGLASLLPKNPPLAAGNATPDGNPARLILAACFIGVCAIVTGLRASQWSDEYRRTTFEAATHPESPRANYEAGIATVDSTFLSDRGGSLIAYQAAHFYFDRAASLDPRGKAAVLDLIYLDCLAGRTPTAANIAELNHRLQTTPFLPGDSGLVQSLSAILVENRLCMNDTQVTALLNALLANPSGGGGMRGMIHAVGMDYAAARLHDLPGALAYAKAAVASDPGSVPLRINLIHVLLSSGDQLAARKEYTALLQMKIRPADRAALDQLREPVNRMN